jgi:allophanate hydrolase subunit 2
VLAVGAAEAAPITVDHAPRRALPSSVRIWAGPRLDWFEPGTLDQLAATRWSVTQSSRVGVRLTGTHLRRVVATELPSEGLVRGAVQAAPGGELVMMLADHPTTGGYPVVAVVDPDDVWIVAQTAPPAGLRFVVPPGHAS